MGRAYQEAEGGELVIPLADRQVEQFHVAGSWVAARWPAVIRKAWRRLMPKVAIRVAMDAPAALAPRMRLFRSTTARSRTPSATASYRQAVSGQAKQHGAYRQPQGVRWPHGALPPDMRRRSIVGSAVAVISGRV